MWQMTSLGEIPTSGGSLEAPSVIDLAGVQNAAVNEHRRVDEQQVRESFMWPGWALPFNGSEDHLFMRHRANKHSGCQDKRPRDVDPAYVTRKGEVATDVSITEALATSTRMGRRVTAVGTSVRFLTPQLTRQLQQQVTKARKTTTTTSGTTRSKRSSSSSSSSSICSSSSGSSSSSNRSNSSSSSSGSGSNLKADFILAGSFLSGVSIEEVTAHEGKCVVISYNHYDVYHGNFDQKESCERVKYNYVKPTPPCRVPINLVECKGLSLMTVVNGRDINIVGAAVHVTVSPAGHITKEKLIIAPDLWDFMLGDHIIRPVREATPAATCMRIAYKAMEAGLQYDWRSLRPDIGVLYRSHAKQVMVLKKLNRDPLRGLTLHARYDGKSHKYRLVGSMAAPEPVAQSRQSVPRPPLRGHPNAQINAEHQAFIDECRAEALERARLEKEALPDGDFWARAAWLETKYNVAGGSLCGQRPKHVGKRGKKHPREDKATRRQRVRMEAWVSSGMEESSGKDPDD